MSDLWICFWENFETVNCVTLFGAVNISNNSRSSSALKVPTHQLVQKLKNRSWADLKNVILNLQVSFKVSFLFLFFDKIGVEKVYETGVG